MSRKTFLAIVSVFGALITVFADKFGLTLDPVQMVAAITAIGLYILFESKLDYKTMTQQKDRWKDPKFYLAFLSAVLVALNTSFAMNLPVEVIVGAATALMALLFKKEFKNA